MIASLIYNTPELIPVLKDQIPSIFIIDAGSSEPIKGCHIRYETNLFWVGNWDRFIRSIDTQYLWMLNSDITMASIEMYNELVNIAITNNAFMVTPSFNSPHSIFNSIGNEIRLSNWVDMCAPLIDVKKYKQIGGFDLNFKGYFADIDLCFRARQENMLMYICDQFKINHIGGYTTNKEAKHEQANLADNDLLINKYGKNWHQLI